jgi:hypothetical protein
MFRNNRNTKIMNDSSLIIQDFEKISEESCNLNDRNSDFKDS